MKGITTHRFRWLALACSLTLLYPLLHANTAAASSPLKCRGWSVLSSPSPGAAGNYLYGVAALSSADVWAVGEYGPAGGGSSTLIEHWNGSQWSLISSPNLPAGDILYAVAAVSSTDVWAAGYYSPPSGGTYTLTEHWNGSQWSVVSSPNPSPDVNYLYGVAAVSSTDAWAVGYFSPPQGGAYTLIEQWNGKHWHQVKSPNPATFANHLVSVSALSNTNAWAVGYYLPNPSTVFNLTEHWNGSHWKVVPSPNPGPDNLRGVALVPGTSQAWAVGFYSNGSDEQTLTEFYC